MEKSILSQVSFNVPELPNLGSIICETYTAASKSTTKCFQTRFHTRLTFVWSYAIINALPNWDIYWTKGIGYDPGACINHYNIKPKRSLLCDF